MTDQSNDLTVPTPFPSRELGRSGLRVSALGLGCMGMSEFYGESDEQESLATLAHAVDLGITFWDTADIYGRGHNEELLRKALLSDALRSRREELVIATKFGVVRDDDGGFVGISGKPEYVHEACDRSLQRLGLDHIDLYYQHRVDPEVPIEDTVGAMKELVDAGKVRHLGLSEASAPTIRRAAATHPITALQTEYSLWTRDLEDQIFPTCRELGIGLVPYSPLGRGFLSGRFRSVDDLDEEDWRRSNPRFQGEAFAKNLQIADRIRDLAESLGCTASQLALAWVLAQGRDVVPIPGTRKASRLNENAAATAVRLSATDLALLEDALPKGIAEGTRYPEQAMQALDG